MFLTLILSMFMLKYAMHCSLSYVVDCFCVVRCHVNLGGEVNMPLTEFCELTLFVAPFQIQVIRARPVLGALALSEDLVTILGYS